MHKLFTFLIFLLALACQSPQKLEQYSIIPLPQSINYGDGFLELESTLSLQCDQPDGLELKELFNKMGKPHSIRLGGASDATPMLLVHRPELKEESYRLNIGKEKITIESSSKAGWIYGFQSFLQCLPLDNKAKVLVRCGTIDDEPRFSYRGMHLDVSRHFFTSDEVKSFVDQMVHYKLNKLHLHLTDDQGWRLEIEQYPLLTEKGAWRTHNSQDSLCIKRSAEDKTFLIPEDRYRQIDGVEKYGGYYTKDDMRDIINYCATRNIEVIPEIDIPGHFKAAIDNYSFLSCSEKAGWGSHFSYPACLGKATTYEFIENIMSEVAELFPSKYIHIGGDEVNKDEWKKCERCQKAIKKNGLKDEHELQSHFNHHIEAFINKKGKQLIGWDEIVEGGLSNSSTVMWWRNWAPNTIREATKNGNKVIMTPDFEYYFDFPYSATPTSKVYNFEPVPDDFTADMADKVWGVQANIWTERIPNMNRVYYQALPRMLALAESGWTNKLLKDYKSFQNRLNKQYAYFENEGLFYHLPALSGFDKTKVFIDEAVFEINIPDDEMTAYYTLDGSAPTPASSKYSGSIAIKESAKIRFRAYKNDVFSKIYEAEFEKQLMADPIEVSVSPGLVRKYFKGRYWKCSDVKFDQKPDAHSVVTDFGLGEYKGQENYALVFEGYYKAETDGIYTFYTNSDDGDQLFIHDRLVVNNDPSHGPRVRQGAIALKAGLHPIRLIYSQIGGGAIQEVFVATPAKEKQQIKPDELFYKN